MFIFQVRPYQGGKYAVSMLDTEDGIYVVGTWIAPTLDQILRIADEQAAKVRLGGDEATVDVTLLGADLGAVQVG